MIPDGRTIATVTCRAKNSVKSELEWHESALKWRESGLKWTFSGHSLTMIISAKAAGVGLGVRTVRYSAVGVGVNSALQCGWGCFAECVVVPPPEPDETSFMAAPLSSNSLATPACVYD